MTREKKVILIASLSLLLSAGYLTAQIFPKYDNLPARTMADVDTDPNTPCPPELIDSGFEDCSRVPFQGSWILIVGGSFLGAIFLYYLVKTRIKLEP